MLTKWEGRGIVVATGWCRAPQRVSITPMDAAELVGYRFARVELDLVRGCLCVDAVDMAATPLPMKLLALLCERSGELVTRSEMFAALWPRQDISDDALNKLISRLRELLGADADVLVTVRRQGLRLDAVVERVVRRVAVNTQPPSVASEPTRSARRAVQPWLLGALFVIASVALLALPAWHSLNSVPLPGDANAMVLASYAVRVGDLNASRPDTAELLRAAEQALDRGDTAQARRLLRSAEDSDPQSALPSALRAIHHGSDEADSVATLVERARQRLTPQDPPYTRLLVEYAAADLLGAQAERAAVDALLTLRPEAWRLRLRRAHLDIQVGNREGALRHLRAFAVDQAPAATSMYVLADRASYGDVVEVESLIADGILAGDPLRQQYVEARIAWTRRAADTGARFEALAAAAAAAGVFQIEYHARELAGAFAYASDDPRADALLRRAAHGLREGGRAEVAAPLLVLTADLAFRRGQADDASLLLRQAGELAGTPQSRVEIEILNARLGLLPRGQFLETAGGTDDRFGRGEPALIAGYYALRAGARAQAHAALDEARAGGVLGSPHAESADLLALKLGAEPRTCWLDPPYPDLARLISCRELDRSRLMRTPPGATTTTIP
jgi:DNA-binding winged helix-turn-helix (wHTH) protein